MDGYYDRKMDELRAMGAAIQDMGDEVAIADNEFVFIGGDSPTSFELSGVTPTQATRLAALSRGTENEGGLTEYALEIGAREVPWH